MYLLSQILNFSIAIAAIIGLVRFGEIYRAYQPFIYITIAGLASEIISVICIHVYHNNAIISNVFAVSECILWFWQFRRWEGLFKRKWMSAVLLGALISVWVYENIILGKITTFSSAFSIAYSFCMVFMAINQVNRLIVQERKSLLVNAKFLICTGVIIFYTYKILAESFYVLIIDTSDSFMANIYFIVVFVNLFVNLLYALATLWIPTRQTFTLPS
jgi:hypothetical protein